MPMPTPSAALHFRQTLFCVGWQRAGAWWGGVFGVLFSLLAGCGGGGPAPLSSAKDITAFAFVNSANPTLATDVVGVVAGDSITLTLPFGQSRSALVASYTALGVSVSAGGVAQASGTSVVNYSSPVLYSVSAADGSVKNYTVTVRNALAAQSLRQDARACNGPWG